MLATPHDTLFKALFSHPRRAAEVLRVMLPSQVARHIDWSTLVHKSGSFIDEEMRGRHVDLLFSAVMAGRTVQIYLLFEHQSTYDPTLRAQLESANEAELQTWLTRVVRSATVDELLKPA